LYGDKMNCINTISGDGEGPSLYFLEKRKARKEHKCIECGRNIEPGEMYIWEKGLWEGSFSEFKTCSDCLSVKNSFIFAGIEYGTIWQELKNHLEYCGGEIGEAHITCLTPAARGRVCDLIQQLMDKKERQNALSA